MVIVTNKECLNFLRNMNANLRNYNVRLCFGSSADWKGGAGRPRLAEPARRASNRGQRRTRCRGGRASPESEFRKVLFALLAVAPCRTHFAASLFDLPAVARGACLVYYMMIWATHSGLESLDGGIACEAPSEQEPFFISAKVISEPRSKRQ